jgi:hypothetical protein
MSGFKEDTIIVELFVSGHGPDIFDMTWNDPKGSGPFKIVNIVSDAQKKIVEDAFASIRGQINL